MDSMEQARGVQRVSIPVSSLSPGWVVDRDIWVKGERLLSAGVEITPGIISKLQQRGIEQVSVQSDSELVEHLVAPSHEDPMVRLLQSSSKVYEQHGLETAIPQEVVDNAAEQMEDFFSEIETGKPLDPGEAKGMIHTIVSLFTQRSHLAIKLLDLDHVDHYTYRHSLNVGLLYMSVANDWVETEQELEDMVFGAMLHDLGKAKVGNEIINKPGKLTNEEWDIMRQHTVWSAELLKDAGASEEAISIARNHHERLDGSGYLDGLKGDELNRWVRLSSICDVYDALTTKRSYKSKMDFAKAIDIIIRDCGKAFDPNVANHFIRKIGRYPAGSFVWLNTGEAAVVLQVNENAISNPVISRVLDKNRQPIIGGERVDLNERQDIHITGLVAALNDAAEESMG